MNSRCQTLPLAALLFVSVLSVSNAQRPTVPNAGSGKQTRFVAPPGEETAAAKQSIDQAQTELRSGKSTTDILTDSGYLAVHQWPRFRALIHNSAQSPKATIVTPTEPGVPLVVFGRVVDGSRQPVQAAIVYVYQTSSKGWYSDRAAHVKAHEGDRRHARLFGYMKTDSSGRFALHTIRPGGYADADLPAHIHVEVEGRDNRGGGLVTEIQFDDDTRLTAEWRRRSQQERFVIARVEKDAQGRQQVRVEFMVN
jgi:protocatechuate 3,4-dioxygenase beta subunit